MEKPRTVGMLGTEEKPHLNFGKPEKPHKKSPRTAKPQTTDTKIMATKIAIKIEIRCLQALLSLSF